MTHTSVPSPESDTLSGTLTAKEETFYRRVRNGLGLTALTCVAVALEVPASPVSDGLVGVAGVCGILAMSADAQVRFRDKEVSVPEQS